MQLDKGELAPGEIEEMKTEEPASEVVESVIEEKKTTEENSVQEEEEKAVDSPAEVPAEVSADEEKAEEPIVAEIKAQDVEHVKETEDVEEVKKANDNVSHEKTRLAVEQEQNSLASDPLGATIVLGKAVPSKEEIPVAVAAPIEPVTSIVPGTTLRRLEDPTPFLFSRPGTLGTLTGQSVVAPSLIETMPKAPRYRVLEAPGMMSDSPASGLGTNDPYEQQPHPLQQQSAPTMTSSPYKVLEAPSSPTKSSATAAASSPNASPMSSRSLASDVLEKARTRFDRFWTKKDSDK